MRDCTSVRRAAGLAAVALFVSSSAAFAQTQLTFQKANSINLNTIFAAGTGYGSNPLSVATDNAGNAYIGGYNSSGAVANIGVVKVSDVLTGTPTLVGLANTQFSSPNSRGIDALASVGGDVYRLHDSGTAATSFIDRLTSDGNTVWQTLNAGNGTRLSAMTIDPVGDVTGGEPAPAVAFLGFGQGRRGTLKTADGSADYTFSGGAKPGAIINTAPALPNQGNWRSIAFDSTGNIAVGTEAGFGVGLRVNENRFSTLDGATNDATSRVIQKNTPLNNIGNGVALLEGAATDELLVFSPRVTGNGAGGNVELTNGLGGIQTVNSKHVQIRQTRGQTGYLTQTQLTGAEDGLGGEFGSEVKNFAVGKDAANQPVLYVVDYLSRRLDVYTIEPKWTNDADGTWSTGTNWVTGVSPDSRITNATFGNAITSARTVTLDGDRTVKQLKFDNANASYTIAGTGTLTVAAPSNDNHTAYINVLNGSHTVATPVTLGTNTYIDVAATGSLQLHTVDGNVGINKRGAGAVTATHLRASAIVLSEGATKIATNGTEAGISRTTQLILEAGTLDLTNNGIIVDYASETPSPYDDLRNAIVNGAITTSEPTIGRILGIVEYGGATSPTFSDPALTIDSTSVLIRYTLKGDSNLDKTVNFNDLLVLAQNYGTTAGAHYSQGDTDYNGAVNFADLLALAQNYGGTLLADGVGLGSADFAADLALAQSLVPEPTTLIGGVALMGLARRRRR